MTKRFFWSLVLMLCIGGSILLAQSEDTEPADFELTCDPEELIVTQAELTALLEEFENQLEENTEETLSQLYEIGTQYRTLAVDCGFIPDDIGEQFVGTDIETVLRVLETVDGDPLNGQLLYNNEAPATDGGVLGCLGCHTDETLAPLTEGTWTRWDEIHSLEPQFEDYTFEHYTAESILLPWDYLVSGYAEVMPNNFGDRLSYQDLADLIAYLESQDQFLD